MKGGPGFAAPNIEGKFQRLRACLCVCVSVERTTGPGQGSSKDCEAESHAAPRLPGYCHKCEAGFGVVAPASLAMFGATRPMIMTENHSAWTAATAEETPVLTKAGSDRRMAVYVTRAIAWWCTWVKARCRIWRRAGLAGHGKLVARVLPSDGWREAAEGGGRRTIRVRPCDKGSRIEEQTCWPPAQQPRK